MMNDKATVTMPLADFDDMRTGNSAYKRIAEAISGCFDYAAEETETLTVDIERLIAVCKQYALYGKDVDLDVDNMIVVVRGQGK